ncbi:MAG: triose-phosphate isomerase [Chitinophagales bacterium]
MMRKILVAGNWKMHKTLSDAEKTIAEIANGISKMPHPCDVWIAPPVLYMHHLKSRFSETTIKLGAQNIHESDQGAFTGEISAPMLISVNADFTIIGHSELRLLFNETNQTVHLKLLAALRHNLPAIICCGETLEERENKMHLHVVEQQITEAFTGLSHDAFGNITIAYEPVWAIGTGVNATPEQAQEMHAYIRSILMKQFGANTAMQVRILYGGSVKPANAGELFTQPDIDGALVGGASLQAEDFIRIIYASNIA